MSAANTVQKDVVSISDDQHSLWRSLMPFDDAVGALSLSHVLISRIDALGDVLLTLPLLGLLKTQHPKLKISFLGRRYAQAIIDACVHVDQFIVWDDLSQGQDVQPLKQLAVDAVLHVFPNVNVAKMCHRAGIPYRFGTAHRWYHWLWCTHRVSLGRSQSALHEAQLNVLLAKQLALLPTLNQSPALALLAEHYGLSVAPFVPERVGSMANFGAQASSSCKATASAPPRHVILHPGSRGSARDWPLPYFVELAKALLESGARVYLTGTEAEGDEFRDYFAGLHGLVDVSGQMNLAQLLGFISCCDALVASSTGPLHIAAALGKKAIGIYPPARPMHAGRWGPVGTYAKALSFGEINCTGCAKGQGCVCVARVLPGAVLQALL